jgi:hypothetical protein
MPVKRRRGADGRHCGDGPGRRPAVLEELPAGRAHGRKRPCRGRKRYSRPVPLRQTARSLNLAGRNPQMAQTCWRWLGFLGKGQRRRAQFWRQASEIRSLLNIIMLTGHPFHHIARIAGAKRRLYFRPRMTPRELLPGNGPFCTSASTPSTNALHSSSAQPAAATACLPDSPMSAHCNSDESRSCDARANPASAAAKSSQACSAFSARSSPTGGSMRSSTSQGFT